MTISQLSLSIFFFSIFFSQTIYAKNLHLIDRDDATGFEIYRSGTPNKTDMKSFCSLGVTEIMVLSGDAQDNELKNQKSCPGLKVIYNTQQHVNTPLTKNFLEFFDQWVEQARVQGKKIAFRCSCGCHRTGRLAAYYRMKYNNYNSDEAIDEMNDLGKWMFLFPGLKKQVRALEDYIHERDCEQKSKYCVK